MLPNPDPLVPEAPSPREEAPVLEVIEDLVSPEMHKAAWDACTSHRWYFGHGSNTGGWARFWKLDLEGDPAFESIWQHVRARCESLAGGPLEVIRVYGNGHTYGLGGEAHRDDPRPGTFTLLYYPNPEWKDGWDGETVYYDDAGEVALAVRYRPNRAVFFDSRILHVGRPPSRQCTALRVSVAYKLQLVAASGATQQVAAAAPVEPVIVEPPSKPESDGIQMIEVRRDGATQVFSIRVNEERVDREVRQRLDAIAKDVRLPGFRPGKIPMEVLQQRYGNQARSEALRFLAGHALDLQLPRSSVPGSLNLQSGLSDGAVEFEVAVTHLPHLGALDFSVVELERLAASSEDLAAVGIAPEAAAEQFRQHLSLQVLDHLDRIFPFPVLPALVQSELDGILEAAAQTAGLPEAQSEKDAVIEQLRKVAERRLRLGYIVAELARRAEIRAASGATVEQLVVEQLIAMAEVRERRVTVDELRTLAQA